jgi:hypothetical protein
LGLLIEPAAILLPDQYIDGFQRMGTRARAARHSTFVQPTLVDFFLIHGRSIFKQRKFNKCKKLLILSWISGGTWRIKAAQQRKDRIWMEKLTRKQAAERLNVSLRTFERLRRSGKIPEPINNIKSTPLYFDAAAIDALIG